MTSHASTPSQLSHATTRNWCSWTSNDRNVHSWHCHNSCFHEEGIGSRDKPCIDVIEIEPCYHQEADSRSHPEMNSDPPVAYSGVYPHSAPVTLHCSNVQQEQWCSLVNEAKKQLFSQGSRSLVDIPPLQGRKHLYPACTTISFTNWLHLEASCTQTVRLLAQLERSTSVNSQCKMENDNNISSVRVGGRVKSNRTSRTNCMQCLPSFVESVSKTGGSNDVFPLIRLT